MRLSDFRKIVITKWHPKELPFSFRNLIFLEYKKTIFVFLDLCTKIELRNSRPGPILYIS